MIYKALSVRLSLMVVCEIALLLLVSLVVMFYFSRQTLKQEAMHNAEHTLEGTVQHIDNVLLSVEQSAGNIYWDVLSHLQEPDRMYTYCRRLIESNRYIGSCTIAFKPGYFSGYKGFLACAHKDSNGVIADERDNQQKVLDNTQYTEQEWYTIPMETGHAIWTNPQKQAIVGNEVVTTFCLPIYDRSGECVGVMAADLSVGLLSRIIRTAKPSDNGYTVLISRNGSFIVHPNLEKLKHQMVFLPNVQDANQSIQEIAKAMIAGKSDFKSFEKDNEDWHVMFKPFLRAEIPGRTKEELNWSIGVVYPDDDIFGDYNLLLSYVLAIAIGGLLLFYLLCRLITHRQLLPLNMLTTTAQHIAQGHYEETIPDTRRDDEIGQLQENFQQMQRSLSTHINTLEQLTNALQKHSKELRQAYQLAQEGDRMKTAFLHNMTNQMIAPSQAIKESVETICTHYHDISQQQVDHETDIIQQEGDKIIDLLNHLLQSAEKENGKEVTHE